ncbi:MAG: Fur family transcriptional regulator [Marivibrio sp.]|uniref:iron response transcriptional regulator IrrA n=1 Tax=Marivibrio sp. TaxID=2039719 RepID=UPI0032ECA628
MASVQERPFADALARLKEVGLRPTRQRLALAKLLFDKGDHHTTAEQLHAAARAADVKVSLATVYNTLHQFKDVGILREVVVEPGRSYFDTNTRPHHHFFHEDDVRLIDIPDEAVELSRLPEPPEGAEISRVEVVIRVGARR